MPHRGVAKGSLPRCRRRLYNREIALENDVVLGSVNANLSHYRPPQRALAADLSWLDRLVSRGVPAGLFEEAFRAQEDDVKVAITLS